MLPMLKAGVVINERVDVEARTHETASIVSILNVGQVALYESDGQDMDRRAVSRLVRKSIELSQLQHDFGES